MRKLWPLLLVLSLVASAALWLVWSGSGRAGPRVVALIQLTAVDNDTMAGFKEGLAKLGYREGKEIHYVASGPVGQIDRLDETVRTLLAEKPDLIFVASTPATQAVKRLTEQSGHPPVIFGPVNDPLAAGIVADLRRPGGHITGIRLPTGDDLRLQWLQRLAPHAKRVYLPYSADDKSALASLEKASSAAKQLGIELLIQPLAGTADMDAVLAGCPANAEAIFIPRDSRIEAGIAAFVAYADKHRLPVAAPSLTQTHAGALFSYGFVHRDIGLQAAQLANQIFLGARAGDLPVEMAESHLAVNLLTAKRIGLAVADDILHQAEYIVRE